MELLTRKRFLQRSASAAMTGLLARPIRNSSFFHPSRHGLSIVRDLGSELIDPATVQSLALRAVDAARSAGADYADVRLTRTLHQKLNASQYDALRDIVDWEQEELCVGVRVLVHGYWGFAASPYWDPDEVARLAHNAVAQAQTNATGTARPVELGTYPVATGSWIMPVRLDPFRISVEEKLEELHALAATASQLIPQHPQVGGWTSFWVQPVVCERQERALATTDGTMIMQTVYATKVDAGVTITGDNGQISVGAPASGFTKPGGGWELIRDARILDQLPQLLAEVEASYGVARLPLKPVEVGRYDMVCDATTVANVLDATFGRATELDRALGYEANASGTSYLGPDPLACLGTSVASPLISVTANRSMPGGLATVKWDDEGVEPHDFSLVTDGKLVDYQTTREQATWLTPWYERQGTPVRSHGCASAADALGVTMQMTPNLALTPSTSATTLADLIAGTAYGIALLDGTVQMDFQAKNGAMGSYRPMYEIRNGKIVARLGHAGVLFNATEFWKNVTAIGGAASTEHSTADEEKGEPVQKTTHTVSAVPMALKNMTVIDVTRKA